MPVQSSPHSEKRPLCVDVDGTLIATDLLYESLLAAVKNSPLVMLLVPFWLMHGLPSLKRNLAARGRLDANQLPLNVELVQHLQRVADEGTPIVLASASDQTLVGDLADRLGFVHEALGTTLGVNLKGDAKAAALSKRFEAQGFDYIGDSRVDLPVWKAATSVGIVSRSQELTKKFQALYPQGDVYPSAQQGGVASWVRALRVYQWLKNLLIFVPLILGHHLFDTSALRGAFLALISFSMCASAVYILNDLLDLESDRAHHRKRTRPFASGKLPIAKGLLCIPLLLAVGLGAALFVSTKFLAILGVYLLFTTAYSFRLKQIVLVDIILLAMLYTVRIVAGGVASQVAVSQWLLGVSMFMFLSLACVKRFSELLVLKERNQRETRGRGYTVDDLEQIAMFGAASGYIAVLVLALYTSSADVVQLYHTPKVIWLVCPMVLYWISRVWLLARRGLVHDDPLVFAMRDKVTYIVGVLVAVILVAAKW